MSSAEAEILEELSPYDSSDLAAGVGALQLRADNAKGLLRIERLAAVVAALEPHDGPSMSSGRWRRLVREPPIADEYTLRAEDPFEEPYVRSISYVGGSYLVLPGLATDSAAVLSRLLEGVHSWNDPNEHETEFVRQVVVMVTAVLRVSDEVLRRGGLSRNEAPESTGVEVPPGPAFSELKKAVRFGWQEVEGLVGNRGRAALGRFIRQTGSLMSPLDVSNGPVGDRLVATPMLATDDEVIILLPGCLLASLRHHIILLAKQYGLTSRVAEAYSTALAREVGRALLFLRHEPSRLDGIRGLDGCRDQFFAFDADKLCHVALLVDTLGDYSDDDPYGRAIIRVTPEQLDEHFADVRLRAADAGCTVLHLIVPDAIGRTAAVALSASGDEAASRSVSFTASDLAVVAHLEEGDPLTLWKFAGARDELRRHANIMAWNNVDEFALYRNHKHSFYISDDARPNLITLAPDTGLDLRMQAATEVDLRGVVDPQGRVVPMMRRYPYPDIPIYALAPFGAEFRLALPDARPRLWVNLAAGPGTPGLDLCDMIAYWLWQCLPALDAPLRSAEAAGLSQLTWDVRVSPGVAARTFSEPDQEGLWFDVSRTDGGFLIDFLDPTPGALMGPDNTAEREFLRTLLEELSAAIGYAGGDTDGFDPADIVDRHAPLGHKKMVVTLATPLNPMIGHTDVPPPRLVHGADTARVLDRLGGWLTTGLGLPAGPIPGGRRVEVLKAAVRWLFEWVADAVAALSPDGVIEFLLAQNESLLNSKALTQLNLPTRAACFGESSEFLENLERDMRQHTATTIASRFIIEYVAAVPPRGKQPVSMESYDALIALAVEITNLGMLSDAIHYGLSDTALTMLPSGRLGIDRDDRYGRAIEVLSGINAGAAFEHARHRFADHWDSGGDSPEPDGLHDLEQAAQAEFGFTFAELAEVIAALDAAATGEEPSSLSVDAFVELLRSETELSEATVGAILDALTLGPRDRFIPKSSPPDVYPWRFNRALSYLRRPLVLTKDEDVQRVWWGSRNTYQSGRYLTDLCASARLKADSEEMARYLGSVRSDENDAFNDLVAEHFEQRGLVVRRRVDRIGKSRVARPNGEDLGDIDVLAADPKRRTLWAVEAKDFELARTPAELKNEVDKLIGGDGSAVARHGERLEWLNQHLGETLDWLGTSHGPAPWKIRGLIVVSRDLLSPHLHDQVDIPITSYRELVESR